MSYRNWQEIVIILGFILLLILRGVVSDATHRYSPLVRESTLAATTLLVTVSIFLALRTKASVPSRPSLQSTLIVSLEWGVVISVLLSLAKYPVILLILILGAAGLYAVCRSIKR